MRDQHVIKNISFTVIYVWGASSFTVKGKYLLDNCNSLFPFWILMERFHSFSDNFFFVFRVLFVRVRQFDATIFWHWCSKDFVQPSHTKRFIILGKRYKNFLLEYFLCTLARAAVAFNWLFGCVYLSSQRRWKY